MENHIEKEIIKKGHVFKSDYKFIFLNLDILKCENLSVIKNGIELRFSVEEFWEILEKNSIIAKSTCKYED